MSANVEMRVSVCANPRHPAFVVTFTGEQAAKHAIDYYDRKMSTCAMVLLAEIEEREMSDAEGVVWEHMNPMCEHGMLASNCWGPYHFMDAAQERTYFDY